MDAERIRQIEALYDQVLKLTEDQRGPFLDSVCQGDQELVRMVRRLLSQDTHSLFKRNLQEEIARLLTPSVATDVITTQLPGILGRTADRLLQDSLLAGSRGNGRSVFGSGHRPFGSQGCFEVSTRSVTDRRDCQEAVSERSQVCRWMKHWQLPSKSQKSWKPLIVKTLSTGI